jgi:tetratricopeptide (TPR) repeat protein
LICGLGGCGKTALASSIADKCITEGKGPVMWMECGNESADTLFEALARLAGRLNLPETEKRIKTLAKEARLQAVHDFLTQIPAAMLVLDNTRAGHALKTVLKAVPKATKVLITSRYRFPVDEIVELSDLKPQVALELLSYHADKPYRNDTAAVQLCQLLGHHAYAIEIAGSRLKSGKRRPGELLRRISEAPHASTMPEGFAETGRESVKALLDDSMGELSEEARALFLVFGGLFAPGATFDLLAACWHNNETALDDALELLTECSLVAREEDTTLYTLHDLTYSYARSLFREHQGDYRSIVAGVQSYVLKHAQDFELLDLDLRNILGAAGVATGEPWISIVAPLAIGGYPEPHSPSYMDRCGHTLELRARLDDAIIAARQMGVTKQEMLHYLLGKRANAHLERGEQSKALDLYQDALDLAPNPQRKVVHLGVIGREVARQGRHDEAEQYFRQGYELAESIHDLEAMARILEQQSHVAAMREDFLAVRDLARRGIDLCTQANDRITTGYFQINLGSAELDLGVRRALQCYEEALAIAEEQHDDALRAHTLYAIGLDYHAMEKWEDAKDYLGQAHAVLAELGHTEIAREIRDFMHRFGYGEPD